MLGFVDWQRFGARFLLVNSTWCTSKVNLRVIITVAYSCTRPGTVSVGAWDSSGTVSRPNMLLTRLDGVTDLSNLSIEQQY
jgi:hypothetical protein